MLMLPCDLWRFELALLKEATDELDVTINSIESILKWHQAALVTFSHRVNGRPTVDRRSPISARTSSRSLRRWGHLAHWRGGLGPHHRPVKSVDLPRATSPAELQTAWPPSDSRWIRSVGFAGDRV